MPTALSLAVRGRLADFLDLEAKAIGQSVPAVLRRRTNSLKRSLRNAVVRAGLGQRLGNTIRSRVTPESGPALEASGLVFSAALKGIGREKVDLEAAVAGRQPVIDLITVFREGATVRARQGHFLAIPVGNVGRIGRGGRRRTPADFPPGTLRFVPAGQGTSALLVDDEGKVVFILVRQVGIRRRLNIDRAVASATTKLDDALVRDIEKRIARLGVRARVL